MLPDGPRLTSIAVFPSGEVSEGGSVTLTCSSDAAPPVESFAWFKGTVRSVQREVLYVRVVKCELSSACAHADMESGSIPDSFSPQLRLSHLRYTDGGEYFCVARNSLGTERSGPLLLNVTRESAVTAASVSSGWRSESQASLG